MRLKKILLSLLALVLCAVFGVMLFAYAVPLEDRTLDLSLALPDGASPDEFDEKGWTVFTQVQDFVKLLEPNGFGGYAGVELGQTFYFSRLMEEELRDPVLQLGAVDRNFSVFLDGELIYTDCPEQDNRIGRLWLPMSYQVRSEPLSISLPRDYRGRVLTIAQSTPQYTEGASLLAFPCDVRIVSGNSGESALIAEGFLTAFLCLPLLLAGAALMVGYVRKENTDTLIAALAAFVWMAHLLSKTSFHNLYFEGVWSRISVMPGYLLALLLLLTLARRAGKGRCVLIALAAACGVSLAVMFAFLLGGALVPFTLSDFLAGPLSEWIATAALAAVLVWGTWCWRKESSFYRLFIPLALGSVLLQWGHTVFTVDHLGQQFRASLSGGQITFVYTRLLFPMMAAALVTVLTEVIRAELKARTEKRLMAQQQEIIRTGYESLRRHQREVMMLRHDMMHHYLVLQEMSGEAKVKEYLGTLIGQNKKIRPVVQSGNEMLDIILSGGLSAAVDAGIRVDILRAEAPEQLPMTDTDQCSLFMNLLGNAVKAASQPGQEDPYIRLDIHVKSGYFMFICENAAGTEPEVPEQEEAVPKHGLGLKIVRDIVERYAGLADTEDMPGHYRVRVAIPLDQSDR